MESGVEPGHGRTQGRPWSRITPMGRKATPPLRQNDIGGLKYFEAVQPLLARLQLVEVWAAYLSAPWLEA